MIFGINIEKKNPATVPTDWIINSSKEKIDFAINKDYKKIILKDLDTLGINEATLFPELDNQEI